MLQLLLPIIYLAFISLGLPDSLLGSAWPVMHLDLGVSYEWAGILSMLIAGGTIVSSLLSDRLTRRFGAGKVTAVSVAMTAAALLGFSFSDHFYLLCLWALPYGLGAGSVDAALNNYVALHYTTRDMSWLHCMWGVGASLGPAVMRRALLGSSGWHGGYRIIGLMQIVLSLILFLSLPLWKKRRLAPSEAGAEEDGSSNVVSPPDSRLRSLLASRGVLPYLLSFFAYCGLETTAGLWAGSFLVESRGMSPEKAAGWAAFFFIGITLGRALNGFLAMRFGDLTMSRAGMLLMAAAILLLFMPVTAVAGAGLILLGLGAAPIFPNLIHSTPAFFGEDLSQAIIGLGMAGAYVGTLSMPALFGMISKETGLGLFPIFEVLMLLFMFLMYEKLLLSVRAERRNPLPLEEKSEGSKIER